MARGPTPPTPPVAATPPEPPPPPKPATPAPAAEPDVPASGLVHEPVSEGKQGSAISVTVAVQNDLQFEKMILAYRPEGASEFLGREMKEVADGRYGAEIPTSATMGGAVAYYIEAEDANGAPVAARGSVDNPLTIRLLGVGVSRRTRTRTKTKKRTAKGPTTATSSAMMAGSGFGWATGVGDTNHDMPIDPAGLAVSGLLQVAPEFGYWLNSSLMLSAADPLRVHHRHDGLTTIQRGRTRRIMTANYALAVVRQGDLEVRRGQVPSVLLAGGGRRPHPPRRSRTSATRPPRTAGQNHNETCVDTIGAGPVLLGPGGGACTTSPRRRRSSCRRTRCWRSPISRSTSTPTWASPIAF